MGISCNRLDDSMLSYLTPLDFKKYCLGRRKMVILENTVCAFSILV